MSKQAAPKLVHGALNVVWEKLETLDFLGVGTQAPPEVRWGPQGRKSNGLTSLRPAIHLKSSTFATPIPNHFRRGGSQNRIGQAHFSLLTECDCLVDGFITDGNDYEMSLRTSEAWSCHDPLHATKTHLSILRQVLRRFCGASPQW
jgi:hypothetical protein